MGLTALPPEQLRRRCDPAQFSFVTTAEVPDLDVFLGQDRAEEALRFGAEMAHPGYNVFVLGPPGRGRHTMVLSLLAERAAKKPTPGDWCYLNNFEDPQRPRAIALPAGTGRALREDIGRLVEELKAAVPAVFDSDEYRARVQEIEQALKDRQEQAMEEVGRAAREQGIELIRTPSGFAFAPAPQGEVLSAEEFEHLPKEQQQRITGHIAALEERLRAVIRQLPRWRKDYRDQIKALNREMAMAAAGAQINALRQQYADYPAVVAHFEALQEDVVEHVDDFRQAEGGGGGRAVADGWEQLERRYSVNVLVDRSGAQGGVVVYEDNPSYQNLLGRLEHLAMMGTLVTDFTLIRSGALHRANGGCLIVDAHKLLTQPFAWEGLKRALRSRELRLESTERLVGLISTVSLEPEPIPLDVKVVLVGERHLYYLLSEYDPEFAELFKVAADFEDSLDATPEGVRQYARMLATMARRDGLRPLDRQAVARVIEYSSRWQDDSEKLSTHLRAVGDLLREADYQAAKAGAPACGEAHVERAVAAQTRRADRVRQRIQEDIRRGSLLLDTAGEIVGQVNGLSVMELGGFSFGIPHRITARVRLGEGEVVDIEREVELGGAFHSKGVLILAGFIGGRYAQDIPLALSASLVFEQSYHYVEGDSASSAELYALLSALAGVPVRQSLAVTGSVNQRGQVQAIGGVNDKIEGFFDVCRERGLSGEQGVLIPAANVPHLMLRRDVVDAVAEGRFHVYAVETVDQGIELLTGMAAGARGGQGLYPADSINGRVFARLKTWAELRHSYGEHHDKDKDSP